MEVELISGTDDPEELVCTAARNDYRKDGVIDHEFAEIMEDVEADDDYLPDGRSPSLEEVTEARRRTLIDHLVDSGHWGPFEHPQATVAIEGVTRVLMAQVTRHRHFTFDILSLRYVGLDGEVEDPERWFQQPEFADGYKSRQGYHEVDDPDAVGEEYQRAYEAAMASYNRLLDAGVPQEQARKVLPMGT
jgi:thymidylate synthase (FAD)